MIEVSQLEPSGIVALGAGLFYSIMVYSFHDAGNYKFHFTVLTMIIFYALISISFFKYLKYRFACPNLNDILKAMDPKIE